MTEQGKMSFEALFLDLNFKMCEANTECLGLLWFDKEDVNFCILLKFHCGSEEELSIPIFQFQLQLIHLL